MFKYIFNKENAFNFVIFFSILIISVYNILFNQEHAHIISPLLGILILFLSISEMLASTFEKIIDMITSDLEKDEYQITILDEDIIYKARIVKEDFNALKKLLNNYCVEDKLIYKYWNSLKTRNILRKIRRLFKYIYYLIFIALFVFLILSHEISPYIEHLNLGDWTILSFVIILFEILIKNPFSEFIYTIVSYFTNKKINNKLALEEI